MQLSELNQVLSHGAISDITEGARAYIRQDPRFSGDTFLKKAEAWAYQAYFLSTKNEVIDAQGRFSIAPIDGLVMGYLESTVAPSNRLPTGHLYEPSMRKTIAVMDALRDTPLGDDANAVLQVLRRDLGVRDYLLERRLEHFYS
jgi:hypothetical protein